VPTLEACQRRAERDWDVSTDLCSDPRIGGTSKASARRSPDHALAVIGEEPELLRRGPERVARGSPNRRSETSDEEIRARSRLRAPRHGPGVRCRDLPGRSRDDAPPPTDRGNDPAPAVQGTASTYTALLYPGRHHLLVRRGHHALYRCLRQPTELHLLQRICSALLRHCHWALLVLRPGVLIAPGKRATSLRLPDPSLSSPGPGRPPDRDTRPPAPGL